MIYDINEFARVVFFFDDDGKLSKEMNIAEFQAVLDGYVPLADLSDQNSRACYLEFDSNYLIHRAVFFFLPINSHGEIPRTWHLPILDLASQAQKAKDLGAGPIQLACFSQCPQPHFRNQLWDPDLSPRNNHLLAVKKAVLKNRVGVSFRSIDEESAELSGAQIAKMEQEISSRLRKEYAQEFRDHIAQLLKEQRLRISSSKNEFEAENKKLKLSFENRLAEYQELLTQKDRLLNEQIELNGVLKNTVDGQAHKISAMREYFDAKIEQAKLDDATALEASRETLEAEISAKFESESKELKEQLQMREVELLYRNELEVQLHDEIARLKEENSRMLESGGEKLLHRLVEKGISLVSFQPGAGHLTLPVPDVANYLENPMAYAAKQCGVEEERYSLWLDHYHMPVCTQKLDESSVCGANIERIESPSDFVPGESNICEDCRKRRSRPHLRLA